MKKSVQMWGMLVLVLSLSCVFFMTPVEGAKKYYPKDHTQLPFNISEEIEGAPPETSPASTSATPTSVVVKTVVVKPKAKDHLYVLIDARRYYEALREIDYRLKKSPNNWSLHLTKAQVLRFDDNFSQAETEYLLVQARSKSKLYQAQAVYGLGLTRLNQAQHAMGLGDQYAYKTFLTQAKAFFQKALQLSPTVSEAWVGLANVAMLDDNLVEAEAALKKAEKLNPNSTTFLFDKGFLLLEQNKPEQAQIVANNLKKRAPEDPRTYLLLGKIALSTQRYDDAIINFKLLADRAPQDTEALRFLSDAYVLKMKPHDAEAVLEKAIAINPMDLKALELLLGLYDQNQQQDRAVLLLKTLQLQSIPAQELTEQAQSGMQHFKAVVGCELVERLLKVQQWREAFDVAKQLPFNLSDKTLMFRVATNYAEAAYFSGQGILYTNQLLEIPMTQQVLTVLNQALLEAPGNLEIQRAILMLNPLTASLTQASIAGGTDQNRWLALQVAFLQGNREAHDAILNNLAQDVSVSLIDKVENAKELLLLGDLEGALKMSDMISVQNSEATLVQDLKMMVLIAHQDQKARLKLLQSLKSDLSETYWERLAVRALQAAPDNSDLRGWVADYLLRQKKIDSALQHQQLAMQYAKSSRLKTFWKKKLDKTARLLLKKPVANPVESLAQPT